MFLFKKLGRKSKKNKTPTNDQKGVTEATSLEYLLQNNDTFITFYQECTKHKTFENLKFYLLYKGLIENDATIFPVLSKFSDDPRFEPYQSSKLAKDIEIFKEQNNLDSNFVPKNPTNNNNNNHSRHKLPLNIHFPLVKHKFAFPKNVNKKDEKSLGASVTQANQQQHELEKYPSKIPKIDFNHFSIKPAITPLKIAEQESMNQCNILKNDNDHRQQEQQQNIKLLTPRKRNTFEQTRELSSLENTVIMRREIVKLYCITKNLILEFVNQDAAHEINVSNEIRQELQRKWDDFQAKFLISIRANSSLVSPKQSKQFYLLDCVGLLETKSLLLQVLKNCSLAVETNIRLDLINRSNAKSSK